MCVCVSLCVQFSRQRGGGDLMYSPHRQPSSAPALLRMAVAESVQWTQGHLLGENGLVLEVRVTSHLRFIEKQCE